jgi:hypothetical protein
MERYTCGECMNSWMDQIEPIPGRTLTDPVTGRRSYEPGQNEH